MPTPPAAMTGNPAADTAAATTSVVDSSLGTSETFQVPRCPPASHPCATRKSAPSPAACCASWAEVTVNPTDVPTPCSIATVSAGTGPKVSDPTSTGCATSQAERKSGGSGKGGQYV